MVTLLTSKSVKSDIEYREAIAVQELEAKEAGVAFYKVFDPTVSESPRVPQTNVGQEPQKTRPNSRFFAGIAHPLVALYDLISGPAMTERDRHRRATGEAALRNGASITWFGRTSW